MDCTLQRIPKITKVFHYCKVSQYNKMKQKKNDLANVNKIKAVRIKLRAVNQRLGDAQGTRVEAMGIRLARAMSRNS